MKLALIRKAYTPFGGAERHVDRFIEGLLGEGHEVHLFAAKWRGDKSPRTGLTVHRVPIVRGPTWMEAWSFAVRSPRLAMAAGCDLVHSFERVTACDVYRAGDGCHREWLMRRRHGFSRWRRALPSLNPLHLVYLTLERRLFEGACRAIIANARRGRAEILAHYRADPDRIHVVYNGVDLDRWRPPDPLRRTEARRAAGLSDGDPLLLLVGSGFERKGVATAIRALAALKASPGASARLAVVGRGSPRRYMRLAASLGVERRVRFVGPAEDVAQWYAAADLLLLPTRYDPFSNVCLEALACGVPVVTSAANGAAEILTAETGIVVDDAGDAEAFARAVESIATSWENRRGACRQAAEHFPFARHLAETLAVYATLRGSRSA